MKFKIKITLLAYLIVALLLASIPQTINANASRDNTEKAISILSDVFSFDLTKYASKLDINVNNSVSNFGDAIQQSTHYTLTSGDNAVSADVEFVGDSLWYCKLDLTGDPIYTQTPSADLVKQSKDVLQRYRAFVTQNEGSDSYLAKMEGLLNQVTELKETSISSGNMRLNITSYPTRISNIPLQFFDWYYTENGIDSYSIHFGLGYKDGVLTSITDTWHFYSVGSSETITQAEAESIAYETAQNYNLEFRSEDGSTFTEKADLSDVTIKSELSMQQRSDSDTAVYPFWDVQFWFNGNPHGSQILGVEVGVWGDTKEVELCKAIVVLGEENPVQSETTGNTVAGNTAFPISTLAIVSAAVVIVALACVGIAVKRKRKKQ